MKKLLAVLMVALLCVVMPLVCAVEHARGAEQAEEMAPVFKEIETLAKSFQKNDKGSYFNKYESKVGQDEVIYVVVYVPEGVGEFGQLIIAKVVNDELAASAGYRYDRKNYFEVQMTLFGLAAMPIEKEAAVATAQTLLNEIKEKHLKASLLYPSPEPLGFF